MKLRIIACVLCAALVAARESRADQVLAADVNYSGSPTQSGFLPWNATGLNSSITDPNSGVSATITGVTGGQGARDRGATSPSILTTGVLSGSPIASLLRDFVASSAGRDVSMTLQIAGLNPNTDYKVTLYGFDPVDNKGRGTSWYQGTDNSGQHIVSFYNNNTNPSLPLGPAFSKVFNTGAGTTLSFFGQGDASVQDPALGNNWATVVVLNGLVVESTAVPEPASLTLWALTSLAGAGAFWRRRKRG